MRYLLSTLILLLFNTTSYSQLKLEDFNNFPLGIYFDDYRKIKDYFNKEPQLLRGDKDKDSYKITYDDIPFDTYGSGDYEFLFVNKVLVSIEIKISFFYDQTDKFKQTFKSLRNTLLQDQDKFFLSNYGVIKYIDAIDFMKKEGKGEYGKKMTDSDFDNLSWMQKSVGKEYWMSRLECKMSDSVFYNLNVESFGREFWNIKKSKQNDDKFIMLGVSVNTSKKSKYDFRHGHLGYKYVGSCLDLYIYLTNEKLQYLRNDYINGSSFGFTGFEEVKKIIELKNDNGVYKIPAKVNNILTLDFVLDLGAADVSISSDLYSVLLKSGSIDKSDILGKQSYTLADGSIVENTIINLKSLNIGDIKLENVKASVSDSNNSPLLLGQSALKKLGKYSIDNKKNELIIE